MNTRSRAVLRRLSVVVLSILVGCCAASSILSCVLISDAILFLDACFALFRLLSMTYLLMVRVLARLSLAVIGACGPAFILGDCRGFVAVRAGTGSSLALPLSMIWGCLGLPSGSALSLRMQIFVCLGPSPCCAGSVAVCSVTGVLCLVLRW